MGGISPKKIRICVILVKVDYMLYVIFLDSIVQYLPSLSMVYVNFFEKMKMDDSLLTKNKPTYSG